MHCLWPRLARGDPPFHRPLAWQAPEARPATLAPHNGKAVLAKVPITENRLAEHAELTLAAPTVAICQTRKRDPSTPAGPFLSIGFRCVEAQAAGAFATADRLAPAEPEVSG